MNTYTDQKFISLLSGQLPLFRWQGVDKKSANFRCPICGDSEKSKIKKRGYFYIIKNSYAYRCHNCGASMSFQNFLKMQNPALYKEYIYEKFKYNNEHRWHDTNSKKREERVVEVQKVEKKKATALDNLVSVMNLKDNHPCKLYVRQRKIPMKFWRDLYFTENYQDWIHKYVDSTKFKYPPKNDYRLVIPFKTVKGNVFAYQGRYIGSDSKVLRYITINPTENEMLLFGLDKINSKIERKWAFEGPIDSLYIPNSVAAAGSALLKLLNTKNGKYTYVFDNEPRSKEICDIMKKVISHGEDIVIWPKTTHHKDVGEMIENDISAKKVLDIMMKNIYNNLQAELKFNEWKII